MLTTYPIRYALNYKGLHYRTAWVEYPDIAELCKKIGAPPTEKKSDGTDHYTLPVIYDPSTEAVVADSAVIAKYLDTTYPDTPRLFPEGTGAFQSLFPHVLRPTVAGHIRFILVARIWEVLNPPSQEYFRRTREAAFGKKLEELKGDWGALEEGLGRIKSCLDANGKGKDLLFMGDRITFADIQLASTLLWVRRIAGEESEDWKKITTMHDGRWAQFMAQFSKYEHVDS